MFNLFGFLRPAVILLHVPNYTVPRQAAIGRPVLRARAPASHQELLCLKRRKRENVHGQVFTVRVKP